MGVHAVFYRNQIPLPELTRPVTSPPPMTFYLRHFSGETDDERSRQRAEEVERIRAHALGVAYEPSIDYQTVVEVFHLRGVGREAAVYRSDGLSWPNKG